MVINQLLDAIQSELEQLDEVDQVIQIGAKFGKEEVENQALSSHGATVLIGCPGGPVKGMIGNRVNLDANIQIYVFCQNNHSSEYRSSEAADTALKIVAQLSNDRLQRAHREIHKLPVFKVVEEYALDGIDDYSCWRIVYTQEILIN
jgi:hypothetical protein